MGQFASSVTDSRKSLLFRADVTKKSELVAGPTSGRWVSLQRAAAVRRIDAILLRCTPRDLVDSGLASGREIGLELRVRNVIRFCANSNEMGQFRIKHEPLGCW